MRRVSAIIAATALFAAVPAGGDDFDADAPDGPALDGTTAYQDYWLNETAERNALRQGLRQSLERHRLERDLRIEQRAADRARAKAERRAKRLERRAEREQARAEDAENN